MTNSKYDYSLKVIKDISNVSYGEYYNKGLIDKLKKVRNQYISVKNSKEHGLGLGRVDSTVEKNKGFVNRQNEEGGFATEIMLPLV